jgi:hypothetical protein
MSEEINKEKITYEYIQSIVSKTPNDYTLGKKIREIINLIKYIDEQEVPDNKRDTQ